MEEAVLLLTMMSMMFTAGICSVLFNKMKLPPIIGYLLAGILLVNVFNLNNTPQFSMETVEILKDLGLVMLMFGIGMELNINKIKQFGKFSALVAIIQLPLMVLCGYAFGMILFNLDAIAALTLGAVISGSSTAVVAAVLKNQQLISKDEVDALFLIMIMEDIGQVLILSMVTPLYLGGQIEVVDLVKLILLIVIFMAAALFIGIKFVPRFLDWVGDNTSAEVLLVLSVGLCFLLAWLSTYIGMSMAIGAFLMGVIVSQSKFCEQILEMTEPMKEVFMAVFFISVGMEVTFEGFVGSLPMAIGIFLLFAISKFTTVFLGYYVGNKKFETSFVCAVSLTAMGEFAFIISSEAFKNGAVNESFYTAVIGAALISMIMLPFASKGMKPMMNWFENDSPKFLRSSMMHLYSMRDDVYDKTSTSSGMSDYITHNLKKSYVYLIVIVLIEIVFSALMTPMTDFVAEIISSDQYDAHYVAYIGLMVVNFFLLVVPTYALVKSIKSVDRLLMEGERRFTADADDEKKAKLKQTYETILNFSTMALVMTIDFVIMAMVPGPFGAEKSSLIVIPIAIAIFIIGLIYSKKDKKKGAEA